ncbi:MAG TPA: hypothetical protein VNB78_07570 [Sphingomicrobium sp.]|jgi:DNA-binding MarR family transcriptional regulator|nr:hypothetical protein [Sphingomicrobium sp.]
MTSMRIVAEQTSDLSGRNCKLEELAAMAGQLAKALHNVNAELGRRSADSRSQIETPAGRDLRFDVRSARQLRHLRRRLFGELSSGPAWDILLHLFESHVLQRRDTVGNVTDGAELPGATALRWIARLEEAGLVVMRDDHLDRRRRYIELSESGTHLMTNYFSGAAPHLIAA